MQVIRTMMKGIFILLMAMAISSELQAQSKIGNLSTGVLANTALELSATNKALTLPYVALTSINDKITVLDPIGGMKVFNTTNAGTGINQVFANCLYVFNGTIWEILIDKTALSSLGTPTVYGTGRRNNVVNTKIVERIITFDDKDATINFNGSISPTLPGYYRFSIKVRWMAKNATAYGYSPLLGTPSGGVSYLFFGGNTVPEDQTIAYSGTIYLDGNSTSAGFVVNYGNAKTGQTEDYYDMAEVVWIYLGDI